MEVTTPIAGRVVFSMIGAASGMATPRMPAVEAKAGLAAGTIGIEGASPDEDPDGQTLFLSYASLFDGDGYVAPRVKIESGARSDHDPCESLLVTPYVATLVPDFDLAVPGVTTIRPERTLWDKLRILHETRQWS